MPATIPSAQNANKRKSLSADGIKTYHLRAIMSRIRAGKHAIEYQPSRISQGVNAMYRFEELDQTTRESILREFDAELAGNHYVSPLLTDLGRQEVPHLTREAIQSGNEDTLFRTINRREYWVLTRTDRRGRVSRVDADDAARRYATTEFCTWYVRGFAKRLIDEGERVCQVYRAAPADVPRTECSCLENQVVDLRRIYEGHRARYYPDVRPTAFSVPSGPNCHHAIRRIHPKS
jgi:hypothetical protein